MIECPTCGSNNIEQAQLCEKCASPLLGSDIRCGLYTYGGTSNGQVLQMRYIITRELSSDFTGVKYLAEDDQEKKDVIIWALPLVAAADEVKIHSLSELCDSLKELTDDHILKVSGFYSKRNARYIVTEYVDGCTLEERIASEGSLNIEEVLEIFSPLARSIDLAHKQGFIHGDISPANILISSKGVVKLANFAIGKAIKEMLALLLPEEDIKPSFYTAPEQSENAICSAKSDIYSLSACISQSLSKEFFSRLDRRQLRQLKQKPGLLPQLSEKQNEVLWKSLSAYPQDRHNSAVELLTELRDSAADIIVVKGPTEAEQISFEKSLAELRRKTQEWSGELEESINKLTADSEKEKQKHAEILRQAQTQARQQAEQLRADYEGKTEQLKAKIAEAQGELAAALSEVDRKTEALVSEKGKALQQSREHEEAINKLIADAEREKQKHAEMLSKAQAQVREQAEQQLADYEEKIVQLRAKIADTELAAVAALGETYRNTEALAAEREKALQQSRENEEAIKKLIADAEKGKQQNSEILCQAQIQTGQKAEQQQADYEGKIKQLEARIAEAEAKLATAVSEANRKTEALAAEKEKALQRSREYEDVIKKLTADAEKEKQQHSGILSQAQIQTGQQAEHQQADYEGKIKQLEARIAETEAEPAAAVSEANRKIEALTAEKEKALQRSRELEEAINKLTADAEKEKQILAEALSRAQTQAREQAEQQLADYEERIEQLKGSIGDAQYAAAMNEAEHKSRELAAEKKKVLQQKKEHEDAIKKMTADAEKEKQILAEALSRAQTQAREQAEQQLADYERKINQLKAKIAEAEAKLVVAMSEAHRNTVALVAEKKKALQQSREHEETLEKVNAEAKQQQKKSAEQLNQAQRKLDAQAEAIKHIKKEAAQTPSRSKFSIIALTSVSIVILGIVTGYLYIKAEKQNKNSLKQGTTGLSSAKQGEYEASTDLTGSIIENDVVKKRQAKNEAERNVPKKTFSELTREAVGFEANDQWEKAIAVYEKALEINKNVRIEGRMAKCWYNLYLSQATTAQQAEDLDKAIELYAKALTYNDNADVREKLEAATKTQKFLTQTKQIEIELQTWLETASEF
jgi:serine/threonine protein kinase